MKKEAVVHIETSDKFGKDYCSNECDHIELYTKFPVQCICKITGKTITQDSLGRMERPDACRYLVGEDMGDERFWSPLRGTE
ncbi:MAG: hypothetical protein DRJ03_06890 [Chloroflexi bacterium]|nr:MAG: hypothetical protein DRJ03_06890 [Chloroflexota bacterium]